MKRLLAPILAAVSLTAFASLERVGSLQVADMPSLGAAVAKVGSFVGNPLATAGMAAAIADMPLMKFFGPMRPGASMVFAVFLDRKELDANPAAALDGFQPGLLYPITISKDELVKRHAGAFETNGVVVVTGGCFGGSSRNYVAFSPDGKWIGTSDHAEAAKLMLEAIPVAEKPMDGDVVRLKIDEKGVSAICAAVKASDYADTCQMSVLESLRSVVCGLRVSDLGIDVRGAVRFAEGSEAAKCGLKPLDAQPLAFAGKSAVVASAQAEDCGNASQITDKEREAIFALFKKHGIDLAKFYACTKTPYGYACEVDFGAAIKMFGEDAGKTFENFDAEKFMKDFAEIKPDRPFAAKAPAYAESTSIRGYAPGWTVADRFAETLPEAAGKQPFSVGFFSLSSVLKASFSHAAALIPEEQRPMLQPMIEQLAVETKRGCAQMCWTQNGAQRFFARISADEIRCVGPLVTTLTMLGTQSSFQVEAK